VRRRFTPSLLLAAVLVPTSLVFAGPATAAPPPIEAAYEIRYSSVDSTLREYGADAPPEKRWEVGTATRTFFISFDFRLSDVFCDLYDASGATLASVSIYGGHQEEEEQVVRFDIPAGVLVAESRYDVACVNGYYGEGRLTWHLIASAAIPGTTTELAVDPARLVRTTQTTSFFDPEGDHEPLAQGERVRVVGTPGAFAPEGQRGPLSVTLTAEDRSVEPVAIGGATTSPDGSSVTLTMPTGLSPAFASGWRLLVRVAGTTAAGAAGPEIVRMREFGALVELTDKATTSSTLWLSASTVAVTKPKATIKVVAHDGSVPAGNVIVYADGYPVARATLTVADQGRIVVPLPRLSRGSHTIVALFQSGDSLIGSMSAPRPLRVLL